MLFLFILIEFELEPGKKNSAFIYHGKDHNSSANEGQRFDGVNICSLNNCTIAEQHNTHISYII